MSYIKTVVVFDGQKEYENQEALLIPEYESAYKMAHVFYKGFIDEINNCKDAYLYIDYTDRPTFQIKNKSEYLEKILPK
tara:strand:- start:371 stop:607 length:237 start_codon:yes stop_codon:yes gene_type:complete